LKSLDPGKTVLDAGTGGGRFLHTLKSRGFNLLTGFDYLAEFINVARSRDKSGSIKFDVAVAQKLPYKDEQFDQCLYLQQLISLIEEKEDRMAALRELKRVLKNDGTAYLSLLFRESREKTPAGFLLKWYLAVVRRTVHRNVPLSMQPWLKRGGRPNWSFFLDTPPYVCWYSLREALDEIKNAGLIVHEAATDHQLKEERWVKPDMLADKILKGFLYIKCRKR
jgi:SAM-dependent methyltransferase